MRSALLLALLAVSPTFAQTASSAKAAPSVKSKKAANETSEAPKPTLANVPYGAHERHILDFWKAESSTPAPLVFVIHGGGWAGGEKERVNRFVDVQELLNAGISVAAINYRFIKHAEAEGVKPPVKVPLYDAARALQFVRSKAAAWNLDKRRVGAAGGSAGACSSLWLALHDDLAHSKSDDPIARESTRLWCAAVIGAQTTLDPQQMKEWTPNSRYGGHAFGFTANPQKTYTNEVARTYAQFEAFLAGREKILPWIAEYSPYALVTADDPPLWMSYGRPPALGQDQEDPTHTANFGVKLQEKLRSVGVECELVYPDAPGVKHKTVQDYLIEKLKSPGK